MSDLAEFLLARITEDEEVARKAEHADGPATLAWRRGGERNLHFDNGRGERYEAVFTGEWDRILVARDDGTVSAHIAAWDPARVLAECEAKRRIVEHHARHPDPLGDDLGDTCAICSETGPDPQGWPCSTLRLLALPYADHPDYRQEWRP